MFLGLSSETWRRAVFCKCPACGKGALYKPKSFDLAPACTLCGTSYADNDSADGPAVFLIFVLGFLLVPLAIAFEFSFSPPLWVHVILWGVLALAITLGLLKPLKSLIIQIQHLKRGP
ncbi:MAG: DUF983 domain-containing protein [Alphaproteobacteria bacterium]|nr:DUF983 domain-containing protein [Alphaproteobacteria bacterium]